VCCNSLQVADGQPSAARGGPERLWAADGARVGVQVTGPAALGSGEIAVCVFDATKELRHS
jgi:hypothetical protein